MLLTIRRQALALYRDESGSEIMEYALITAVLSMTVAAAFSTVANDANTTVGGAQSNLSNSGITPP